MSQWNNSYAYNNQYQGANNWNGDLNNQYMNQAYYQNRQFDPSNQYVSFDEFISQMQSNSATPAAGNFNNMQYQNFAAGQYNYQNMPSTSTNAQLSSYNYGPSTSVPNEPDGYQAQSQYQLQEPNFTDDMVFKSNLTPTATEFVPKCSVTASASTDNVSSEAPAVHEGVRESKSTHGSSTNTNWRERPHSSQQNGSRHNDKHQQNDSNKPETNYKNNEASYNRNYDRNNESRTRNQESSRYENRNQDSRNESNRNDRNFEASNRNESRNYETNRNQDRNYEPSRYDRGQSKNNSKTKIKDSERTFYNSSINKSSQDVRIGREGSGRNRNWVGSQRVRRDNTAEDEQYANSYLQQREEKAERASRNESVPSPSRSRNKPAADIKGEDLLIIFKYGEI